jgi:uncharacterized protein YndB with AHSA1/START domain
MPTKKHPAENTSDRELVFERIVNAPRELVWEAWTDQEQVVHWWGPKGFTNTIHEMAVRPGGLWRLTMHGPDGTNYPNRIEFIDVVKPERLVYHHGDDANPRMFHVTTTFTTDGDRTKIVSRIVFKTPEECAEAKKYAIDGHKTSMERLDSQLANMAITKPEIVSTRIFSASRELVFQDFSDPNQLKHWWGPKGFTNTFHEFDLRPGGKWRFIMHGPNGTDFHNKTEFIEVAEPERIVFQHLEPIHRFQMTMSFDGLNGKTQLTWRMRFESFKEQTVLRDFITAANEENFDRLAAHLTKVTKTS